MPKPTKPQPKRQRKAKKEEIPKKAGQGQKSDDEDGAQESMDEVLEKEDDQLKQERELDEDDELDPGRGASKPAVPTKKPARRKAKKNAVAPGGANGAEDLGADDEKEPKEKKRKEAVQECTEDKGPDDLNGKKPAKSRRTDARKATKVEAETRGSKEDEKDSSMGNVLQF